ncbi:hypothetical protein Mgra_00007157 [Meloidogyne graminicola]|uniref:Uncharacterized protein n=1 Tax=Meloidogyne graminicola TaxID=189291 RepID=A0A8S9ZJM6_9BILA|nr:hypothetical protein Mgra_00007157 [Meloidogyne graminicola]
MALLEKKYFGIIETKFRNYFIFYINPYLNEQKLQKLKKLFLNKIINERKSLKHPKINEDKEEFFVDYAVLAFEQIVEDDDDELSAYFHFETCFTEEDYFYEYCQIDLMTKPMNAEFNDELTKLKIFSDGIVDNKGNQIIKLGYNISICLDMFSCPLYDGIIGNKENITKIAKSIEANYNSELNNYYLNGLCNDKIKERKQIGLELKNANITINFNGKDLANYSYNNTCKIGLNSDFKELSFPINIFNNYCIFFDSSLKQVAFSPKKENIKELEYSIYLYNNY